MRVLDAAKAEAPDDELLASIEIEAPDDELLASIEIERATWPVILSAMHAVLQVLPC